MRHASDPDFGWPLVERSPSKARGGRPAPRDVDLAAALAALLEDVVQIVESNAIFAGQWAEVAELALEHASVLAVTKPDHAQR